MGWLPTRAVNTDLRGVSQSPKKVPTPVAIMTLFTFLLSNIAAFLGPFRTFFVQMSLVLVSPVSNYPKSVADMV